MKTIVVRKSVPRKGMRVQAPPRLPLAFVRDYQRNLARLTLIFREWLDPFLVRLTLDTEKLHHGEIVKQVSNLQNCYRKVPPITGLRVVYNYTTLTSLSLIRLV